jgi:hypothetical protein
VNSADNGGSTATTQVLPTCRVRVVESFRRLHQVALSANERVPPIREMQVTRPVQIGASHPDLQRSADKWQEREEG